MKTVDRNSLVALQRRLEASTRAPMTPAAKRAHARAKARAEAKKARSAFLREVENLGLPVSLDLAANLGVVGSLGLPLNLELALERKMAGVGANPMKTGKLQAGRTSGPKRPTDEAKGRAAPAPSSVVDTIAAISPSAFAPGPRAKAVLRGVEIAQEDLRSSGGAYDIDEVRRLLHGVSRQRIDKRVREGSLLAVPGPSNKRHFPAVQFKDDGTVVEGLPDVLEALPTKNGFAILNFLIHADRRLDDRKPIDLLKAGEVDLVVEAARRMGEQGA
jgi:hypothetical protein